MNNPNTKSESQNWRAHSYMEESRSHSVPRPQNYYTHYPPSQFINDYLQTGYVYPGLLPSYRSGEGSLPPPTGEIVGPLPMISSEDFAKYYNKMQNYMPQDPRHCIKGYSHHPPFYENPRTPHFHNVGLENGNPFQPIASAIYSPLHNSPNHIAKSEKNTKNKGIIVIESDEENIASKLKIIKVPSQKNEEKLSIIETQSNQKKKPKSQEIEEEKNEITNKAVLLPAINPPTKETPLLFSKERQRKPQFLEPPLLQQAPHIPANNKPIYQIIPIQLIDELRNEILHELQVADLPDQMMKIFLTYKTLDTYSQYRPDQKISRNVLNSLKIYRATIELEKQRKYFIQQRLQEEILKRFNYSIKTNICKNMPYENTEKFTKLAQQLNQYDVSRSGIVVKDRNGSNLLYPPKTKKISKRDFSDHNSQQISQIKNKINEKEPSQVPPSVACERRLRDRKKKKNKKQKYEKTYSQNYLKQTSSREKEKLESSRPEKPQVGKQNSKVDIEFSQQDEGLIQKIQGWAERTALAYAIEQKHKKTAKNAFISQNPVKNESFKPLKKDQQKKYKERSSKASQNEFKSILNQKIFEQKTQDESKIPNLMTFVVSNNLTEVEKEEFQRKMAHLTKQLKNNQNHGRIRIGKEYYQAKMPRFIQSETELSLLISQKREKLMERKMGVLTF